MSSTKYLVFRIDAEGNEQGELTEKPFSKRGDAVELAQKHRRKTGEGVRARTEAGHVAFEQLPKKSIAMSKRFTRVVELPEGAKVPAGLRVAYDRKRKNLAIVHNPEAENPYGVVNYETGEVLASDLPTTRSAGAFCKTVEAKAEEPEPANA